MTDHAHMQFTLHAVVGYETLGTPVADLGFHEGGFIRSGEKFCKPRPVPDKTTPFYVVEEYPTC